MSDEIKNNGIENEDIEYIADAEFEEMIRNGLNASFDDESICVSDELIAKTLKAIEKSEKQPEPLNENKQQPEIGKTKIFSIKRIGVISGIAAALFLGVIGISMLGGGMAKNEMSNDAGASETYSMRSEAPADSSCSAMQKSDFVQMNSVADATCDICEDFENDCMEEAASTVAPTTGNEANEGTSVYRVGSDAMDRMIENLKSMVSEASEKTTESETAPEALPDENCYISVICDEGLAADDCETISSAEAADLMASEQTVTRCVMAYSDRIVIRESIVSDDANGSGSVEKIYSENAIELVYEALDSIWEDGNGGEN